MGEADPFLGGRACPTVLSHLWQAYRVWQDVRNAMFVEPFIYLGLGNLLALAERSSQYLTGRRSGFLGKENLAEFGWPSWPIPRCSEFCK